MYDAKGIILKHKKLSMAYDHPYTWMDSLIRYAYTIRSPSY